MQYNLNLDLYILIKPIRKNMLPLGTRYIDIRIFTSTSFK